MDEYELRDAIVDCGVGRRNGHMVSYGHAILWPREFIYNGHVANELISQHTNISMRRLKNGTWSVSVDGGKRVRHERPIRAINQACATAARQQKRL